MRDRESTPATASEALAEARRHARAALSESIAAVHSLLDAVSLASAGEPSEAHRLLGPIAKMLEGLRGQLGDDAESTHLLGAIADALDAEIARWELRARDDANARSVLRAFIGLRELLWEFGIRPTATTGSAGSPENVDAAPPGRPRGVPKSTPKRRKTVQRINVEG